jgi:hypothetical protein
MLGLTKFMYTQNEYLHNAETLMADTSSDVHKVVSHLHRAIECGESGTNQGSSRAYFLLGQVAE